MKWDGQTTAVVGSAVATVATVIGTAISLGTMIQTGHAQIRSDIRELSARISDVETGLRGDTSRLEGSLRGEIANLDSSLHALAVDVDARLDSVEWRLTRIEVHLYGLEPESVETP